MDIHELTAEMNRFVESQGWYEANSPRQQTLRNNSPRQQTLRNLAISLCLEGAEILEHFQWNDTTENPEGLAEELADVALYLLQIASVAEIDLEAAILQKLNRNYQRTWNENNPDQGMG
jgi:NTP pyrophosphatase (non-canonical NTP hydrolase)